MLHRFQQTLWDSLARTFNRSSSPYLICYEAPKYIIRTYKFDVELLTQTSTSMHGSKEGHTGYIYRRRMGSNSKPLLPDKMFRTALEVIEGGLIPMKEALARSIDPVLSRETVVTRAMAKANTRQLQT
jgi:hypothetical protein